MELNREQIVKALECCVEGDYCATCPATDYCEGVDNLTENALSLIKELTEEAEEAKRLADTYKRHHDIMDCECSRLEKENDKLTEENERLRAENAKYEAENHAEFNKWLILEEATKRHHSELFEEAKIAVKEETVRKMQERLKESISDMRGYIGFDFRKKIDQIAKEMLEG